jgi:hypothetical protein
MTNSKDDGAFDDGSRPYVESLLRALDEPAGEDWLAGGIVSSDGPRVTVEWPAATYIRRLSVRVARERSSYEFHRAGPEVQMSGSLPIGARASIDRIEDLVIDIARRNLIEALEEVRAAAPVQAINQAKNRATPLDDMPDHAIAAAAISVRLKRGKTE